MENRNRKIGIAVLIVLVLGLLVYYLWPHKTLSPSQTKDSQTATPQIAINGLEVKSSEPLSRPFAAVIENHPDARPQSGLAEADIVFEAIAEGGITRFLAIYQSQLPSMAGPIRSARTYFAQIADACHAIFAHAGGNSDALAQIKRGDYLNLSDADQFFNDQFYFRKSGRVAPHNLYTTRSQIQNMLGKYTGDWKNTSMWKFSDTIPVEIASSPAETVSINFSTPSYVVRYVYNDSKQSYDRFQAGKAHVDDEDIQITASTVIVMEVVATPTKTDTVGSRDLNLETSGKATILRDGKSIVGYWSNNNGKIYFQDARGNTIPLKAGPIWIEMVSQESTYSIK